MEALNFIQTLKVSDVEAEMKMSSRTKSVICDCADCSCDCADCSCDCADCSDC